MHWQKCILLALCVTLNTARKRNNTKLTLPIIPIDNSDDFNHMTTPCEMLRKEWEWNSFRGELYEEPTLSVALLTDGPLGEAAAALLRATLIAAGFNSSLIKLLHRDLINPITTKSNTLVVEPMVGYLQVRLTPSAAHSSACANASTWSFYQDESTLRECGFIVPGTKRTADGIIYFVNQWDEKCAGEFIDHAASSTLLDLQELDRLVLEGFIRNSNNSFLFLDNYQWTDTNNVRLVKVPNGKFDTNCASDHLKMVSVSLKFGDGLPVPEPFLMFSPTWAHLKNLSAEYEMSNQSNIEEVACGWALREKEQFSNWQIKACPSTVVVIICNIDLQDFIKELLLLGMIEGYTNTYVSTLIDRSKILIQDFFIDCTDTNWLFNKLMYWYKNNLLKEIEGVILTEDLAAVAASLAMKFEIPLLTYDVNSGSSTFQPMVSSATGSIDHLALALQRLLEDCGWHRLAIISEPTSLAASLSNAISASNASSLLKVRKVNINSPLDAQQTLKELFDADARVFFVNTAAAMAATVLDAAKKLNMTRNKGFTWIVREYDAADNATTVTRPYSVSFWWRGESKSEKNIMQHEKDRIEKSSKRNEKDSSEKETLRVKLEQKWRGCAWPLHAAPVLDALLTFREGIRRDKNNYTWTWNRKFRSFWSDIKSEQIQGIMQNLTYGEHGVTIPLVFVLQWGSEPRPRVLATWHGGEWRNDAEACPTEADHDGSTLCIISSGDPFHPNCRDAVWITCRVLTVLIVLALIIATIRWIRKTLLAHDLRIKTECTKRILARRERVFEALAEHLVERSALELLQELGTGRFGRVYHGVLRESGQKHRNIVIAAKTLREEASSAEESEFLREACTLATLDHEHIIRFVGVCVVDGPPLLIMEHAYFGDLLQYLQARRGLAEGTMGTDKVSNCFGKDEKMHVTAKALTKLAQEAATALTYLGERGIVHRDVRASNCLVDERRCLKLADFGLARATGTVDGEYACRRGMFPVLWMAPESLATGVSSVASDVWSFGVLVFELVTLGRRPYGTQAPRSVLEYVLAGGRPRLPWDASADTRALVRACWRRDPEARPTAAGLADWLTTRWRALRPALVEELVDIESHVYGYNVPATSELSLHSFETTLSKPMKKQKSS